MRIILFASGHRCSNFRWNGRAASAVPYLPPVLARRSPRRSVACWRHR